MFLKFCLFITTVTIKMLRSCLLILSCASLAYCGPLKITSDELQSTWYNLTLQMRSFQAVYLTNYADTVLSLSYTFGQVKVDLSAAMLKQNMVYESAITSLIPDALTNGQDLSSCLESSNQQLIEYDREILGQVDTLYNKGIQLLSEFKSELNSTDSDIIALGDQVKSCDELICAFLLKTEIENLNLTFVDSYSSFIKHSQEFQVEISAVSLDETVYQSKLQDLIDGIKECLSSTSLF